MTACAMTVGMVPMALALERGSQMQAPLGLAVIGGLVMSTFATLLVLPSIFAVVIGRQSGPLAVDLPGRPRKLALRPAMSSPTRGTRDAHHSHADPDSHSSGRWTTRRRLIPTPPRNHPPYPEITDARPIARFLMFLEIGKVSGAADQTAPPPYLEVPDACAFSGRRSSHRSARPPSARVLALGRPGGAGLRPRGQDRLHDRLEAPDRAGDQPAGPDHRPGRRPAELHRSYERTSIFPKLTGYIEKWNVDIGDKVKKGETLATLFVPELVEDFGTKKATVELDKQRIELARKVVKVAEADVKAAKASLAEAKAILDKFEAEVERWDSEVKRLQNEVERGVVDPQVLLESTNQLKSSTAAREAAKATIAKAEAELLSRRPRWPRPRSTSRSPRPACPWPRARRSGSRPGWATSRSPLPSTA